MLLKCKFLEIVGPDSIYFLSCSFTQQIILYYLVGLVSCLSIESRLQIYLLFIVVCPSISRAFISMLSNCQPRECCTQWYQSRPLTFQKMFFTCFNDSPSKMMKNAFCFILKTLFVLRIFKFLPWLFGHVEKTAWLER